MRRIENLAYLLIGMVSMALFIWHFSDTLMPCPPIDCEDCMEECWGSLPDMRLYQVRNEVY